LCSHAHLRVHLSETTQTQGQIVLEEGYEKKEVSAVEQPEGAGDSLPGVEAKVTPVSQENKKCLVFYSRIIGSYLWQFYYLQ
jgi:hypothetical protein